jgi:RHS repeat-associated protein
VIKKTHITQLRQRATSGIGSQGSGGGGGVMYVLSDAQGSSRAVMNNSGAGTSSIVARHDYLPFGEEIGSGIGLRTGSQGFNASDTNRKKYGLTERDNVTGLDHTWFRKYENLAGRWTSPDPYAGSMHLANPQSFNRYAYVQNDPVNFVDPSGLLPTLVCYWGPNHTSDIGAQWTCVVLNAQEGDGRAPFGGRHPRREKQKKAKKEPPPTPPQKTQAQKQKDYEECMKKAEDIFNKMEDRVEAEMKENLFHPTTLGGAAIGAVLGDVFAIPVTLFLVTAYMTGGTMGNETAYNAQQKDCHRILE